MQQYRAIVCLMVLSVISFSSSAMQESGIVSTGSILSSYDYHEVQQSIENDTVEELYSVVTRSIDFLDATVFHALVYNGNVELVRAILKRIEGSEYEDLIDRKTSAGKSPLSYAAEVSDNGPEMAQLLIDFGAKLDGINPLFCTYDVAQLLIRAGYDLDKIDLHGKRKFEEYSSDEEISPVVMLIERSQKHYQEYCKYQFLPKDYNEQEAVINRLFYAAHKKMGRGDASWKCDLETVYLYYINARQLAELMRLIKSSDFSSEILLEFNQWIPKYFDWFVAIKKNEIEALQAFFALVKQYNLNFFYISISVKSGFTPLKLAVFYGYEKIIDLLLDAGVRVDQKQWNESPLCKIFEGNKEPHQHVSLLKKLLRAGANPNARDLEGYSALYNVISASSDNPQYAVEMVQLLLQAGAYPNGNRLEGQFIDYRKLPIYCAIQHGCLPVIQLLAAAGSTIKKGSYDRISNTEIVRYLATLENKYKEFEKEVREEITEGSYFLILEDDELEASVDVEVEREAAINRWYYECVKRGKTILWVYNYYIRLNNLEELGRLRKSRLLINNFEERVMPTTDRYFSKSFNDLIKDAETKRAELQQKIYNQVQSNQFLDVLIVTHQKPLVQKVTAGSKMTSL